MASEHTETSLAEHRLVLPAILLVGLALRLYFFVGVGGWDDVSYLAHIHEINSGTFDTEAATDGSFPFKYRVGLILPTAFLFRIFGTSEPLLAVLPLLCSLGTIYVTWRLGRLLSPLTGAIAGLLMATLPCGIVSATSLLPTPCGVFFCGLSVLLWVEAEGLIRPPAVRPGAVRYFLIGMILGCAYLFRLEAGLYGIVFIVLGLAYCRPHAGWFVAAIGVVLVIGAENYVYWSRHGEWLYRLKVVSSGFASFSDQLSAHLQEQKSVSAFVKSVFLKPTEFGLHAAAAFVGSSLALVRCRKEHRPLLLWFWPLLAYLCFGTWSLTSYVPTTKDPRYLLQVAIPGFVLLAAMLTPMVQRKGVLRAVALSGLSLVVAAGLVLSHVVWVYRHENAAGAQQLAATIRSISKQQGWEPDETRIWAEHYVACNLRAVLPEFDIRAVTVADKNSGHCEILVDENEITSGIVVNDVFLNEKYSTETKVLLPEYIRKPPRNWSLISKEQTSREGISYDIIRWLAQATGYRINGLNASLRVGDLTVYVVEPARSAAARCKECGSQTKSSGHDCVR